MAHTKDIMRPRLIMKHELMHTLYSTNIMLDLFENMAKDLDAGAKDCSCAGGLQRAEQKQTDIPNSSIGEERITVSTGAVVSSEDGHSACGSVA